MVPSEAGSDPQNPKSGAERRQHARADVHLPCELESPHSPFRFKAEIVNLSAGGMKLNLPRNVPKDYLTQPFYVHWAMGGHAVRALVYLLYHFGPTEVAVRFVDSGSLLTSEVARYVYIALRSNQLKNWALRGEEAAPGDQAAQAAPSRQQRRDAAMRGGKSLSDAWADQVDRHKNPAEKWLARRIVPPTP